MNRPTSRPSVAAFTTAMAALALASGGTVASGQTVFDPYQPERAPYYEYTTPTVPNNLALPNAAREASAYATTPSGFGGSRYNTLDRYLSGGETDIFSSRRGTAYDPSRRPNPYADNLPRGLDDRYYQAEKDRADRAYRRDQLYRQYTRETNAEKKVAILREIRQLSGASHGNAGPARPGVAAPRPGASTARTTAPPLPRSNSAPPAPSSRSNAGRSAASGRAPEPPSVDRRSSSAPSGTTPARSSTSTATAPPPGTGPVPEPDPIPDVPPPPR